jgi:hypothetical protein
MCVGVGPWPVLHPNLSIQLVDFFDIGADDSRRPGFLASPLRVDMVQDAKRGGTAAAARVLVRMIGLVAAADGGKELPRGSRVVGSEIPFGG